jgi:hypothetical protein
MQFYTLHPVFHRVAGLLSMLSHLAGSRRGFCVLDALTTSSGEAVPALPAKVPISLR